MCTPAHDAVYYVFRHRKELNFTSLLDSNSCIALPDTMILNILHAHVRAESISLGVPCTFSMFAELESYFWRVVINQDNLKVGHPSGNLQYVDYRHYYGLQHSAPKVNLDRMIKLRNTLDPFDKFLSRFNVSFAWENGEYLFSQPYSNWCNTNLGTRYHVCPCCQGSYPSDSLSSDGLCTHCHDSYYDCS